MRGRHPAAGNAISPRVPRSDLPAVPMPMMEVRVMGMAVDEFSVRVAMRMRLAGRILAFLAR